MAGLLRRWIGMDRSPAELSAASAAARGPLIRSSATHLPVADRTTEAVVCSMAMQVIQPVEAALAEVARVLRPGGRAVLLLPATGPLGSRDALMYLRLEAVLRRRIRYPNDRALAGPRLTTAAGAHGLAVTTDERRTFLLSISSEQDVVELVHSLYLPGIHGRRLHRAVRVLRGRVGSELAVPLRRVVLDRVG